MKLSSREDVALPIAAMFRAVSDFEVFERRVLRRGADISRTDPESGPGKGSTWEARFQFRGRERDLTARVTEFDAPSLIGVTSISGGLKGDFTVSLVALTPRKTRMIVGLDLTPNNLSARLFVQSLKLAKSTISKRFETAVADYARGLERSHAEAEARAALS
ncbi:MAG: SRPBCC family protein [Pseudomonadota bacterium]